MCKYTYVHIHEIICCPIFASNEKIWSDIYQTYYKKNDEEGATGNYSEVLLYILCILNHLNFLQLEHIYILLRKNKTK